MLSKINLDPLEKGITGQERWLRMWPNWLRSPDNQTKHQIREIESSAMVLVIRYQNNEEGIGVTPQEAEDPLLFDGWHENTRENAEWEDQIRQRHAKHQSV